MALDKGLMGDVMDASVIRGMFEGWRHYAIVIKIKILDRLKFRKGMKVEKEALG